MPTLAYYTIGRKLPGQEACADGPPALENDARRIMEAFHDAAPRIVEK
jgi:hypothetical protein